MPVSAPPYRPSTGAFSDATTSMGCLGCRSSALPTSRPYQATPAFRSLLWAAYSQTIRPPQQKPVMPSFGVSPLPVFFALATVELGSDGQVAQLGEAPADVLDMLVDAEDFLHDQDDREGSALGRHGA